jgi:hypothetical protein
MTIISFCGVLACAVHGYDAGMLLFTALVFVSGLTGIVLDEVSKNKAAWVELHEATKDLMASFTATGPKFDRVRDALKVKPKD